MSSPHLRTISSPEYLIGIKSRVLKDHSLQINNFKDLSIVRSTEESRPATTENKQGSNSTRVGNHQMEKLDSWPAEESRKQHQQTQPPGWNLKSNFLQFVSSPVHNVFHPPIANVCDVQHLLLHQNIQKEKNVWWGTNREPSKVSNKNIDYKKWHAKIKNVEPLFTLSQVHLSWRNF